MRRPLSPGVYRRRRLGVAVTAVLLVVATVDLVNGDDGASGDDTVQQVGGTPSASPTATTPAGVAVGPTTSRPRRRPAAPPTTPAAPPPAEPEGSCADSDVTVRPEVEAAVAGNRVVLTLALNTTKAEACTWTVSAEHLAYKITDDDVDVWASSDCPAQVPTTTVVVRRDLVSTLRLAWNGRESSRDCPDSMPAVDPGTYAVQAAAIGGEPSAPVRFKLADPAKVESSKPAGPSVPKTKSKTTSTSKSKSKSKSKKKSTKPPTR